MLDIRSVFGKRRRDLRCEDFTRYDSITTLVLALFVACTLGVGAAAYTNMGKMVSGLWVYGTFASYWYMFVLYALLIVFFVPAIRFLSKKRTRTILAVLFAAALIPRLAMTCVGEFIPFSDFGNYPLLGKSYVSGDKQTIADLVCLYKLKTFSFIGPFYGLPALFSADGGLLPFQIFNSIMTSLSCCMLFLLGRRYNKSAGLLASLLYAVYPSNLVFSQVTTNQHGAALFALISVYLITEVYRIVDGRPCELYRGTLKKIPLHYFALVLTVLSAICMFISHGWHPGSIVLRLAVYFWGVGLIVTSLIRKNKRRAVQYLVIFVAWALVFTLTLNGGLAIMQRCGYISEDTPPVSMLSKIVVGLNREYSGHYCVEDYEYVASFPPEQQSSVAWNIILERTADKSALIKLFYSKIVRMWLAYDTPFGIYTYGMQLEQSGLPAGEQYDALSESYSRMNGVAKAFSEVDRYYCYALYLFAVAGLFLWRRRCKQNNHKELELTAWMLCGWIGVHLFIEINARYRYMGMLPVMLFAAIAMCTVYSKAKKAYANYSDTTK